MTRLRTPHLLCALALLVGCTDDLSPDGIDGGTLPIAEAGAASDGGITLFTCPPPPGQDAPSTLDCTGLYSNFLTKEVAPGVREFAPAVALWSDGAQKKRWIQLPPGTKIDNSDPHEWVFPVGTKFFKEFSHNGHRVETRLWVKVQSGKWVDATYAWNQGETATRRVTANLEPEAVPMPNGRAGEDYIIPSRLQCATCHKGRKDIVLGFDQVLLGLPGATGITLDMLVKEGLLTNPPSKTTYQMPDDGTGMATKVLPWIHVNCGVSCHSDQYLEKTENPSSLVMRIFPEELDGKPVAEWRILRELVGAPARLPHFAGQTRIIPGDPDNSLLWFLASQRGRQQMPLIATRVIDPEYVPLLKEWIIARGALVPKPDSGVPMDSGTVDAAVPVDAAPVADATVQDAEADGGVDDAEVDAAVAEDSSTQPGPTDPDAGTPPAEVDAAVEQDAATAPETITPV